MMMQRKGVLMVDRQRRTGQLQHRLGQLLDRGADAAADERADASVDTTAPGAAPSTPEDPTGRATDSPSEDTDGDANHRASHPASDQPPPSDAAQTAAADWLNHLPAQSAPIGLNLSLVTGLHMAGPSPADRGGDAGTQASTDATAAARTGEIAMGGDAAGTAAVLGIARWLKDHPPENSVIIALFDGEEQGLLGAAQWAREARERRLNIEGNAAIALSTVSARLGAGFHHLWEEGRGDWRYRLSLDLGYVKQLSGEFGDFTSTNATGINTTYDYPLVSFVPTFTNSVSDTTMTAQLTQLSITSVQ